MSEHRAAREVILLSAGTEARRKALRAQSLRLMPDVNWSSLAEILHARRLLPVLGPRILELSKGAASEDFAAAVSRALEAGRRQGAFLQLICLRVMTVLADAGIRSSPLKGPLLGEAIYGDPSRRPSSDIDLLVAPEQLQKAVDLVRELGYSAPTDYVDRSGLPLLHFALVHERGELPPIELHWRIHWYESRFASERLLPPVAPASPNSWRPAPADELAALLLFYARDGFIDLRLATDLSAWWDAFGVGLPPGALNELVHTYPALSRVVNVAAKVAENTVGLPATSAIAEMPRPRIRDRLAIRMANPNPHASQSQLYAERGLVDGLLSPPGGFGAFVRRQVLPPHEVLDQQARFAGRDRRRSSLSRCMTVVARYGLAMTRLIRPAETLH
jgi:Uncharacterised nucleotidyltransferase